METLSASSTAQGVEGIPAMFEGIKNGWGSVFGPANREGTILNMLFG